MVIGEQEGGNGGGSQREASIFSEEDGDDVADGDEI